MQEKIEITNELLSKMPTVESATIYGSGFYNKQVINSERDLDVLLSVYYPSLWHRSNRAMNPYLYDHSAPKHQFKDHKNLSFKNAFSFFCPKIDGKQFRITVVDQGFFNENLRTWNHLIVPGRLQKETKLLIDNSNGVLPKLIKENHKSALNTALLLSNQDSTKRDIYRTIASLSYAGDLFEYLGINDPTAIENIVRDSYDFFEKTYGDNIDMDWVTKEKLEGDVVEIVDQLPSELKKWIYRQLCYDEVDDIRFVSRSINEFIRYRNLMDNFKFNKAYNKSKGLFRSTKHMVKVIAPSFQRIK